jgi:hypothetical protein
MQLLITDNCYLTLNKGGGGRPFGVAVGVAAPTLDLGY